MNKRRKKKIFFPLVCSSEEKKQYNLFLKPIYYQFDRVKNRKAKMQPTYTELKIYIIEKYDNKKKVN